AAGAIAAAAVSLVSSGAGTRTALRQDPIVVAPEPPTIPVANARVATTPAAALHPEERADQRLVSWYRAPLAGRLLVFPPCFSSSDGRYDVVLHLNGNTDLVEESYGYAKINAVVVILNLGVGSGVYESRFADPASFSLILDRVQSTLKERGLQ